MSIEFTTAIDINATKAEVWAVLTDFAAYGQWSNFSSIEGEAVVGSRLAMRMPGFSFKSTVTIATPEEELQWSATIGSAKVFLGAHSFALSSNPDGTTRLANTETFSGALVKPFEKLFARSPQENGYAAFNRAIKQRVEGRHSASARTVAPTHTRH